MMNIADKNRAGLMGPEHVKTLAATTSALALKADAAATTAALALKADSTAVTNAVAAAQAAATELQKDFVASGAITAGQYVVLRSDGKVEAVTGTETLASIGPDNSALSAANELKIISVAHNVATDKIAMLYANVTTTDTLHVVIGSVTGDTITFGTPVTVDTGGGVDDGGSIAWDTAGNTVFLIYKGANTYPAARAGTVTGTSVALGTATTLVTTALPGDAVFFDEVHGSRVIFVDPGGISAATHVGNVLTFGTRVTYGFSGPSNQSHFYDATNARGFIIGEAAGTIYVVAFTVAGTAVTVGAQASNAGYLRSPALDRSSGKVVLFRTASSTSASPIQANVVTFSGATTTINPAVTLTAEFNFVPGGQKRAVFDADSGKVVVFGEARSANTTPTLNNIAALVCTVSGTTISSSALYGVKSSGAVIDSVMQSTSGPSRIAITYRDETDYQRVRIATGRVVSGAFVVDDDTLVRSSPRPSTAGQTTGALSIIGGWKFFDFGNWSLAKTNLVCFAMTLPGETTNADAWIGVAKATVANGATVTVALRGGLDKQRSGLTAKTRYFLRGDGTLIANDNGRPAGIALSATELLMEAA